MCGMKKIIVLLRMIACLQPFVNSFNVGIFEIAFSNKNDVKLTQTAHR